VGALQANTVGNGLVALGQNALAANTSAGNNTAVGQNCLSLNSAGIRNTAVGQGSLYNNVTSDDNVAVGVTALVNSTSGQNTAVGSNAGAITTTGTNNLTLGGANITVIRAQVTSITALSDARDKTDVADLPQGLNFVNALRPVKYTWNSRDGAIVGKADMGFLAQDVLAVQGADDYLNLVYQSNPEKLELTQGRLIPILVKAIQELSAEVAALKGTK
jgi:hypothetical protein